MKTTITSGINRAPYREGKSGIPFFSYLSPGMIMGLLLSVLLIFSKGTSAQGLSLNVTTNNATCNGICNGSAIVIPSGGTAPYTYSWSNGEIASTIAGLCSGTYTIVVTDAASATIRSVISISEPAALSIAINSYSPTSCGSNNGMIILYALGGTPPYNYLWDNGETNEYITSLSAGDYGVTVTDGSGCKASDIFQVANESGLAVQTTENSVMTCNGNCDGSAAVIGIGGTIPYSYQWNTGATEAAISGLCANVYTAIVTDNAGCSYTSRITITQPAFIKIGGTGTTECNSDGSATAAAVMGGTPPYTWSWSNGENTSTINNLISGVYSVTVTDNNGCTAIDFINIAHDCSFNVSITSTNANCNEGCNGTAIAQATGGTPPYDYFWITPTGQSLSGLVITGLCAGTYSVYVGDSGSNFGQFTVEIHQSLQVVALPSQNICLGNSVYLQATGANFYVWSPTTGLTDASSGDSSLVIASPLVTTIYTVAGINGCSDTVTVFVNNCNGDVWPGDANADFVANVYDILPIGVGYNATGTTRVGATTNWVGQVSTDWTGTFASWSNYKHADCNGDGTINLTDVISIGLNYGQTHNKKGLDQTASANDPALYLVFSEDTLFAGETVSVPVFLGTNAIPANNVYGLAFSVHYDSTLIESPLSTGFIPSWLGTVGTDLISVHKDIRSSQQLDVGVVRTNQNNVSGYGQIGTLNFTMKDDISGKTEFITNMILSISDVLMISNNETPIPVNALSDTVTAYQGATGIRKMELLSAAIKAYPNPASNLVTIDFANVDVSEVKVVNTVGQVVYSSINDLSNRIQIDTKNFPMGMYYVSIATKEGIVVKPISIINR